MAAFFYSAGKKSHDSFFSLGKPWFWSEIHVNKTGSAKVVGWLTTWDISMRDFFWYKQSTYNYFWYIGIGLCSDVRIQSAEKLVLLKFVVKFEPYGHEYLQAAYPRKIQAPIIAFKHQ